MYRFGAAVAAVLFAGVIGVSGVRTNGAQEAREGEREVRVVVVHEEGDDDLVKYLEVLDEEVSDEEFRELRFLGLDDEALIKLKKKGDKPGKGPGPRPGEGPDHGMGPKGMGPDHGKGMGPGGPEGHHGMGGGCPMMGGQQGPVWSIERVGHETLLFNAMSGETFVLREKDGHLAWECVPRLGGEMDPRKGGPDGHGFPGDHRGEGGPRREDDRPGAKEELEKIGEALKKIEEHKEELIERARELKKGWEDGRREGDDRWEEDRRDDRRDDDRGESREEAREAIERALDRLRAELKETDSKEMKRAIKDMIGRLEDRLEDLDD